jgi:hypothetical protein
MLTIISQDELNLGPIGAMAVSPSGRKVYLGRYASSDADRLNLVALSLDAEGNRVGEPTLHPDSDLPLVFGLRSSVVRTVVNPAGTKLYLAYTEVEFTSTDPRNLTVYDLDDQGEPLPGPRTYASGNPSQSLLGIALHPTLPVLYLTGFGQAGVNVYHLDAEGEPKGSPQPFPVGDHGKFDVAVGGDDGIRLGTRLYLGTYPDTLEIVDLDGSGHPIAGALKPFHAGSEPGSQGQQYLAFDYTPRALYRRPLPGPTTPGWPLVVWPLDQSGDPVGTLPQQFPNEFGRGFAIDNTFLHQAWFTYDHGFGDACTGAPVVDGMALAYLPLDPTSGLPEPPSATTFGPVIYMQQGQLTSVGPFGAVFVLTQAMSGPIVGDQVKDYWLRVTIKGADLATGPVATPFPAWLETSAGIFDPLQNVTQLGQPLAAVSLDPYLKGMHGQQIFWVWAYDSSATQQLASLSVTLEFFQGEPPIGLLLKSLTDTVVGNRVAFLVPGYGFEQPGRREAGIELLSAHAAGYLATARAVGIDPVDRPTQFVVTCYAVRGSQGHSGQFEREAETVALLGVNTVLADQWPGLAPSDVNANLDAQGLHRRLFATNTLPSYFDFNQDVMNDTALAKWAAGLMVDVAKNGGNPASLALFQLADEPNWFYPDLLDLVRNGIVLRLMSSLNDVRDIPEGTNLMVVAAVRNVLHFRIFDGDGKAVVDTDENLLTGQARQIEDLREQLKSLWPPHELTRSEVTQLIIAVTSIVGYTPRNDPGRLAAFRRYLASHGQPSADALPIGASEATDPASRRLFYWTMRFFTESASQGFARAAKAIVQAAGHSLPVYVNFTNFFRRWYVASPNQKVDRNPDTGPDAGLGYCDWMFSGRLSAHTLWTEDWFPDQQSQYWSVFGDALRSASMLGEHGEQGFGGHVVGLTLGGHPAGASYKILSLIGHGAKYVDIYAFGPGVLWPTDAWSEESVVYKPYADALRLVGRAERLLYPGQPRRGKVAIMAAGPSMLWDENPNTKMYQLEPGYLHFALTHSGYTVDFVDETDIECDQLAARGYTALYLTGPNVGLTAQGKISDWVYHAGGVLAVVLGAAVADEYNTGPSRLDPVLGLGPRSAVRDMIDQTDDLDVTPGGTMTLANPAFGAGLIALGTPVSPLPTLGASVAATLPDGCAAITVNSHGQGQAIAYGFFPGRQYWQTQDVVNPRRLPLHWDPDKRRLAVAPAALAKTPFPVKVSVDLIEACRLDSAQGIAVVLLNWNDGPFQSVTVTVAGAGHYQHATSVQHGSLTPTTRGDDLVISVPIEYVDVLLIE